LAALVTARIVSATEMSAANPNRAVNLSTHADLSVADRLAPGERSFDALHALGHARPANNQFVGVDAAGLEHPVPCWEIAVASVRITPAATRCASDSATHHLGTRPGPRAHRRAW
jgi:hypothetical protein